MDRKDQEPNRSEHSPSPAAVPSELMADWATMRYNFEVAKFHEQVERARRDNEVRSQAKLTDCAR